MVDDVSLHETRARAARADLERSLTRLRNRVTPVAVAGEGLRLLGGRPYRRIAGTAGRVAGRHPLPVVAAGLAVAAMVAVRMARKRARRRRHHA